MRTDEELRRDVLRELRRNDYLRIADLRVRVESQVVMLDGKVSTPAERWQAFEIARNVAGLAPVANNILVLSG